MALLSRPLWSAGALAFPPTNNQRVAEPTNRPTKDGTLWYNVNVMSTSRIQKKSKKTDGAKPKKLFVRKMVRAGIPQSRSERLAKRFWVLARPEAFGRVVKKMSGGKTTIFQVRPSHGGPAVFVVKQPGNLIIRTAEVSDRVGRKKHVTAHR